MARIFEVSRLALAGVFLGSSLVFTLRAENPAPPKTPDSKPASTNPAPVAPKAPVPPPPPSADFNRYGKILTPSDDAAHPLKLNLPFPGVGEMKIPSQDDLMMRDKLESLAVLSDDEILKRLSQWPPYGKMKIGDQGRMLIHIQDFKERRTKIASDKARDLGLTLTPAQQVVFEKRYWDKRLAMERELLKKIEPVIRDDNQKMKDELFREFSSSGPVVPPPPAAKAPPTPAPPSKPPATAVSSAPATNSPVVGQGMMKSE